MNLSEYENYQEKKTHFDASFPYNTYLCCIPQDFLSVPLHWHQEMEIIYIKKDTAPYRLTCPLSLSKKAILSYWHQDSYTAFRSTKRTG